MVGPVILPLHDAVAAVASASELAELPSAAAERVLQTHVHAYEVRRDGSGTLFAGHVSHQSHASHASHVSSAGSYGGGDDDGGGSTYVPPVVHHAPGAPGSVSAVASDGSATVSWAPVTSDDGGSVTYVVTAAPGNITARVVGVTSATLNGLQDGTAYTFTVVALNTIGQSPASTASAPVTPLIAQLIGPTPTITGQPVVGQKLSVQAGDWPDGTSLSYQWLADGEPISAATGTDLELAEAQAGARISVAVSGTNPAYARGDTESSDETLRVATTSTPTISPSKKVRSTLVADAGLWTPGTKFTYVWFVNGHRVSKHGSSSLRLGPRFVGKTITVHVTGTKPGYPTVTRVSTPTPKVRAK